MLATGVGEAEADTGRAGSDAGPRRLSSLDALRGFDMFWIIGGDALVHAVAAWTGWAGAEAAATQMTHVTWDGFRFYDLIFPLFIFVSGVALPFSLGRRAEAGESRRRLLGRAARRSLILVALGVVYNNGLFQVGLSEMRYPSVLGRIGLAYLGAAALVLFATIRGQVAWLAGLLLGYWAALALVPVPGSGAGVLTAEGSLAGYVDRAVVPGSLFLGVHDPEGLFSTLPAVATALMGVLCGHLLRHQADKERNAVVLLAGGALSLGLGWLWDIVLPVNKNLWTSSFVLVTAGWSMMALALFYYLMDVRGWQRLAYFFVVIGSNAILVYLSSHVIDVGFTVNFVLGGLLRHLSEGLSAVVWWVGFIAIEWLGLWFLYRRRILLRV